MMMLHPFHVAVNRALREQGLSKAALCDAMGHAPGWYSAVMRRVANGTATLAEVRAIAEAVADTPEEARALARIAVAG